MNSQGLQGARQAELRSGLGNPVFSAGGLAIDAVTSKFKTVSTISFAIDGVFKSKAAATALAFSAGHVTVPDGYSCIFLVALDAAGNVTTYQGDCYKAEVDNLTGKTKYRQYLVQSDAAGNKTLKKAQRLLDTTSELAFGSPTIPDTSNGVALGVPENVAVVGAIKVAAAGADFVPGTTALTGIATYYDLAGRVPAATNL